MKLFPVRPPRLLSKSQRNSDNKNPELQKLQSPWRPDKGWRILPLAWCLVLHQLNVSSLFSTNCFPSQLLQKEKTRSSGRCMTLFTETHTQTHTHSYLFLCLQLLLLSPLTLWCFQNLLWQDSKLSALLRYSHHFSQSRKIWNLPLLLLSSLWRLCCEKIQHQI